MGFGESKVHLVFKVSQDGMDGMVLLEREDLQALQVWWDRKVQQEDMVERAHRDRQAVMDVTGMTVSQAYLDEMVVMAMTVQQACPDERAETGVKDDRVSEELQDHLDLVVSAEKLAVQVIKDLKGLQAHKVLEACQDRQASLNQCQKKPGLPQVSRSWL